MGYRTTAITPTLPLLLICSTLFSAIPSVAGNNDERNHPRETVGVEQDDQQVVSPPTTINDNLPPSTIIDTAKSLFSPLSTTRFVFLQSAASNSWTWIKLMTQMMFKQSPDIPSSAPSLDFRRQVNDPEEASAVADADAADKVKEAVVKSLDQGAVVIENSARSAAKLAGDAIDTTAKKLRKTVGKQSEAEL